MGYMQFYLDIVLVVVVHDLAESKTPLLWLEVF